MEVTGQVCPGCFPSSEGVLGPIAEETGWAPEPAWALWRREKVFILAGIRTTIRRMSSP